MPHGYVQANGGGGYIASGGGANTGVNSGYYYRHEIGAMQGTGEAGTASNGITKVSPYLKYSRDI